MNEDLNTLLGRLLFAFFCLLCISAVQSQETEERNPLSLILEMPAEEGMVAPLRELLRDKIAAAKVQLNADSIRALASLYQANGYELRAEAAYYWLLEQDLDQSIKARVCYSLAAMMREKGNVERAREYLERSVAFFPDYALSHFYLAEVLFKTGDIDGAADSYEAALRLAPLDSAALLGLARVKLQKGELEESRSILESLLEDNPDNYNARSLLAQLLSRLGEREKASALRASYAKVWEAPREDAWLDPVVEAIYDPQRLSFRYEDYKRVGDYDRAFAYLDRMESIDPEKPDTSLLRALLYSELGRFGDAGRFYREAINRGGDFNVLYPMLVDSLLKQGRTAEAEAIAREGVTKAPDSAKTLTALAKIIFEKGRFGEARSLLKRSMNLDPYDTETLFLHVRLALQAGQQEEAKASIARLQQLAPRDVTVMVMLGLLHMEAGMFADALPVLEKTYEMYPENSDAVELLSDAHFELGRIDAAKGDLSAAMARFEKALSINPNNEAVLQGQVQIFAGQKRYDEAGKVVERLLRLNPGSAGLLLSYGDLLFESGKQSLARARWRQALEQGAGDPQIEQAARSRLQQTQ